MVPTKPQVQTALTVARIHVHDIMARANQYQRTGGVQSNFKELQSVEALSVRTFGCGRQAALVCYEWDPAQNGREFFSKMSEISSQKSVRGCRLSSLLISDVWPLTSHHLFGSGSAGLVTYQ